ncbi:MAG: hypothetical protein IH944_00625 [Armatimonadetes bacterium]|nr:hypothetical protein [Armatimonadota bacterium]
MKWFVLTVLILLIPVLMITCKKPDITGTWIDYVGVEQRVLRAGSGITLRKDGAILHSYHRTSGQRSEMKGRYRFEDGRLKVIEEEKYTIDADGNRTDHLLENWVAEIEFVTPNEIVMKHPTQGNVLFRREAR